MKILLKYALLLATSGLLLFGCEEFLRRKVGGFAGSYPFVESWDLEVGEPELLQIITKLQLANKLVAPPGTSSIVASERSGYNGYWLDLTIYYADTDEVVRAWTRPDSKRVTTLAFYSIVGRKSLESEKLINRDFWFWDNRHEINKFKTSVIDKIQKEIDASKSQLSISK